MGVRGSAAAEGETASELALMLTREELERLVVQLAVTGADDARKASYHAHLDYIRVWEALERARNAEANKKAEAADEARAQDPRHARSRTRQTYTKDFKPRPDLQVLSVLALVPPKAQDEGTMMEGEEDSEWTVELSLGPHPRFGEDGKYLQGDETAGRMQRFDEKLDTSSWDLVSAVPARAPARSSAQPKKEKKEATPARSKNAFEVLGRLPEKRLEQLLKEEEAKRKEDKAKAAGQQPAARRRRGGKGASSGARPRRGLSKEAEEKRSYVVVERFVQVCKVRQVGAGGSAGGGADADGWREVSANSDLHGKVTQKGGLADLMRDKLLVVHADFAHLSTHLSSTMVRDM